MHQKVTSKLKKIKEKKAQHQEEKKVRNYKKVEPEVADKIYLDIRTSTVIRIMIIILLIGSFYTAVGKIGGILLLFFVATIFAAAISPIVDFGQTKKIPRAITILCIYVLFFTFIGLIATSFIPLIIDQVSELVQFVQKQMQTAQTEGLSEIPFGNYIEPYVQEFLVDVDQTKILDDITSSVQAATDQLQGIAGNAISLAFTIFGGLLQILLMLFLIFYMLIDTDSMEDFAISLIPRQYHHYVIVQAKNIQQKLGAWLRGQIIISFLVGGIVFTALTFIGVKYAFTFALVAMLTELVPVVGPLIAMIICIPIILTQGLGVAFAALIFFIILNWVESNIIVPFIMNKSINLSPMIVILAMLIGSKLLGVVGIILSIPVAASTKVLVMDYVQRNNTSS